MRDTLRKFLRTASITINPPKKGDQFLGQSQDFVMGSVERSLHRLNDLSGAAKLFHFSGLDTYKLTVTNTQMPYYICEAAVLTKPIQPTDYFEWSPRVQVRRMSKEKFKSMFVEGKIRRAN